MSTRIIPDLKNYHEYYAAGLKSNNHRIYYLCKAVGRFIALMVFHRGGKSGQHRALHSPKRDIRESIVLEQKITVIGIPGANQVHPGTRVKR